ncbi:flavin reductase family protein [Sphingobium xenophagum]|nr:flavin reductase family protein [Sphingobium xenophagum]
MRDALRRLAKAVVVITCRYDGKRYAMAATAVSELSLDPPSMLVCVNRHASLFQALASGSDFAINILHSSHAAISAACGGKLKGEERFEVGNWTAGPDGLPFLSDAQASFICINARQIDHGTHAIFIGDVREVRAEGVVDPLIYVDGRYCSAT